MKLPNFRLYETQALFGALLGGLAVFLVIVQSAAVFRNFDPEQSVIWHNPRAEGLTGMRESIIVALTGISILVGVIAGVLGFNSLGQRRNNRQGLSWLGLALGALAIVVSGLQYYAWYKLNESLIVAG